MDLHLHQLRKIYDDHVALEGVDLELQGIRALVLIGPSGGGKSTLLRLIAALEIPTSGQIQINGGRLDSHDETSLRRHRSSIGFVFQAHNLFPHLTALRNITLPLEKVHGLSAADAKTQAIELLRRFQLDHQANRRPAELSGGQQQRVAIARAVAIRPRLLLFDEPTSALDPEMTAEVLDMIGELRTEGRDFILATHEMGFARRVADHIAFVGNGGILAHGPVDEMLNNPPSIVVRRFLDRVLNY